MGEAARDIEASEVIVYFVDDDRGMVSATSQWLSLSGLKVRAFADPSALLKVLKPNQPCVVISDVRMPDIDGIELMKLIRSRDKRVPVILITGHGDIPLAVEAMKHGAFEFVQKPFSPEKLLEITRHAQKEWYSQGKDEAQNSNTAEISEAREEIRHIEGDETQENRNLADQVDEFEKDLIETSMKRHRGAIPKVIEELAIPRRTLNAKMKKYGIFRAKYR